MLPGLELEAEDVAWLLADVLAAASVALEPGELARQLGDSVPDGREMMFGVMARLPHPDVADVLTLIGTHHPDKKVAKAARRSAYRASGRIEFGALSWYRAVPSFGLDHRAGRVVWPRRTFEPCRRGSCPRCASTRRRAARRAGLLPSVQGGQGPGQLPRGRRGRVSLRAAARLM